MIQFFLIGSILLVLFIMFGFYLGKVEKEKLAAIKSMIDRDQFVEAFNAAQKLISTQSSNSKVKVQAYYYQAQCLFKKGDLTESRKKLKTALLLNPLFDQLSSDAEFQDFVIESKKVNIE